MRIPQELIDAVIDCIGAKYTHGSVVSRLFHRLHRQSDAAELTSLAPVSRACNHRVRSHLFASCKVTNVDSQSFENFEQCPDVLLGYTRILTIRYGTNPITILAILRRFASSPLVSIKFFSTYIPEELPEMLKSDLRNVCRVEVAYCTLSPVILINLVGALEHIGGLRLQGCRVTTALERGNNLPSLPPLQGHLSISETFDSNTTSLLSRVVLPLRSLHHVSRTLPSENNLINACAGSLENLEVKMVVDWTKSGFTLDLGHCTNLQHITFIAIRGQDKNTATQPLSELLLTLRVHQLLSIRMVPFPSLDAQEHDLPELKAWGYLDQILYNLGGQAQARGGILTFTFQSASLAVAPKETLAKLLPRFNQIGICEGISV